jgi:hypothetical protein
MYILGAVAMMILFVVARAKLRIDRVRWAVVCLRAAVDIFLGAKFIIDRIV